MIGTIATGARRTPIGVSTYRSSTSAITARKPATGGMSATKPTNGWSGTAAISGEHTSGADVNGGRTKGVNNNPTTKVFRTATTPTEAVLTIVQKTKNGAPLNAPP